MSTPQVNELDVQLAKFGGVNLKSSSQLVAYITLIGTFCVGTFGHDWGIQRNAQTIAYAAFALITAAHLLARSIHHSAVEQHNGAVKVALIEHASLTQVPVVADSPPQASTSPPVDPVTADTTASTDTSWATPASSSL